MDSQSIRRTRESGSDRVLAQIQPPDAHGVSGRDDRGGGIDGVAAGHATALSGRAGFFVQVEHGLDARYAGLFRPRPDSSEVSPERPHLRDALSSSRKFYPAAVAR